MVVVLLKIKVYQESPSSLLVSTVVKLNYVCGLHETQNQSDTLTFVGPQ